MSKPKRTLCRLFITAVALTLYSGPLFATVLASPELVKLQPKQVNRVGGSGGIRDRGAGAAGSRGETTRRGGSIRNSGGGRTPSNPRQLPGGGNRNPNTPQQRPSTGIGDRIGDGNRNSDTPQRLPSGGVGDRIGDGNRNPGDGPRRPGGSRPDRSIPSRNTRIYWFGWSNTWWYSPSYWRWYYPPGYFLLRLTATAILLSAVTSNNGNAVYYDNGVYYQEVNGGYEVIPAPAGASVTALPEGFITTYVEADEYYYYLGTFYQVDSTTGHYVVINAPAGAIVPYLPEDYEQVIVDGENYYLFANTYYRPYYDEGEVVFVVVDVQ
jgi:hypothetical protein